MISTKSNTLALSFAAAAALVATRYLDIPALTALLPGRSTAAGGVSSEALAAKLTADRTEFNKRFALLEARGAANWAAPAYVPGRRTSTALGQRDISLRESLARPSSRPGTGSFVNPFPSKPGGSF